MTRNQNLYVAFVIAILAATLMLIAYVATVHAAPARPPRDTTEQRTVAPRPSPPTCEWNRYTTPRNCNPERRPHDRSVPR